MSNHGREYLQPDLEVFDSDKYRWYEWRHRLRGFRPILAPNNWSSGSTYTKHAYGTVIE